MARKLYIAGGPNVFAYGAVSSIFKARGWEVTMKLPEADLVSFNGGADINPALYHELPHKTTSFHNSRDQVEVACFNIALQHRIPMVGICRGAQLLNVLCGGSLWQDVDGHGGTNHEVIDVISKKRFMTNSLHHQMMRPAKNAIVIGVAYEATVKEHMGRNNSVKVHFVNGKKGVDNADPEVVFYDEQRCLCFQGHPEFTGVPGNTEQFMEYVETYLMQKAEETTSITCGC